MLRCVASGGRAVNTLRNTQIGDPSVDYVGLERLDREELDEETDGVGLERLDCQELDEA
jgi:hypothetical protein